MKDCQWLALFSLANCPKEDKLAILKEAKKYGLKIFLSLHGTEYYKGYDYLKDYLAYCDMLQLNAHELANIFNKKKAEELDFIHENFSQKLNVPLLVVGHDIHGGYAYTKDKIVYQPPIEPKVRVDTTGAGDALASGFLGTYIKTQDVEKSLLFGTQNAVAKMEVLGAQAGLLRTK
jgi:sugar/nucleoside kinase (ribokinase family)